MTEVNKLMETVIQKMLQNDVPKEPQKEVQTVNMNITAIKITPDTLIPGSTSLNSPKILLPEKGLLKLRNRNSDTELPNDEDIYNMKMINWVSNPLIQDIRYLESTITSIAIESLDISRKNKKV